MCCQYYAAHLGAVPSELSTNHDMRLEESSLDVGTPNIQFHS
jgi:hypothetical protein